MGNNHHVIARRTKSDVAISWCCVRNRTMLQEIATASGLAMTAGDGSWFFSLTAQESRVVGGVSDPALH